MNKVRVLIVDDSKTMRAVVRSVLLTDPLIEVVGEAEDAFAARIAIKKLNPDVITLDIEMPKMDGIEFLEKLMRLRPMPVIMCSTLTQKGAAKSIDALSMGAFDCVGKPVSGNFYQALAHLPDLVKAAAQYKPKGMIDYRQKETISVLPRFKPNDNVIAIGSSTGGVEALQKILSNFPENCPPTMISQHMPEAFLKSFSQRLDQTMAPRILTAQEGMPVCKGHVYFAPGGETHLQVTGKVNPVFHLHEAPSVSGHRPSIDVMMMSVVAAFGHHCVGVQLTGMGRDGARGLLAIREAGGRTFGQDENSSSIYGMAKVAKDIGAVERELPLSRIGLEVLSLCQLGENTRQTACQS